MTRSRSVLFPFLLCVSLATPSCVLHAHRRPRPCPPPPCPRYCEADEACEQALLEEDAPAAEVAGPRVPGDGARVTE